MRKFEHDLARALPHGGLVDFFQKATCPREINFEVPSPANLVTCTAEFRGNETFAVHLVASEMLGSNCKKVE